MFACSYDNRGMVRETHRPFYILVCFTHPILYVMVRFTHPTWILSAAPPVSRRVKIIGFRGLSYLDKPVAEYKQGW
jgi:hypothetical protein